MIKDFDYTIKVGKEKAKQVSTEKIVGELDAIIVKTNKPCEVYIRFLEIDGIFIYKCVNFNGSRYIPIRVEAMSINDEKFNFVSEKFALNNKLIIDVRGQQNTTLNITLRVKNAS